MSLERFRETQNAPVAGFDAALDELRAGAKRGHWIWYVFPQIEGLGMSPQSRRFALRGEAEAAAFLRDAELRARLLTITRTVIGALRDNRAASLRALMGSDIDARKVVSSLTLFRHVARTLYEREGLDEYRALAGAADAVLARAAGEGYPPCVHTLERLVK